jgi:MFS transporter, DHA1 family, multidrug resistance protein
MTSIILPAVWLIILIVGLPQLSETVYTPSLPDIAQEFATSVNLVEHTLTVYLLGFAIGTLFWGKLSDKQGRKPCVIAGLLVFSIGCVICYFSNSIETLMIGRFVQAFGGSISSVIGQAICRDAFKGPELGKVYSMVGSALALFPALGPLCGSFIAENFGWKNIFIFLILFAFVIIYFTLLKLPETHPHSDRKQISIWYVAKKLMNDKTVLSFGLIVAACNGILFSYFAEGPFYLINALNLSINAYGMSFMLIAAASMAGGILSKRLHNHRSSKEIMTYGIFSIAIATTIFSLVAIINHSFYHIPNHIMISLTLISQMVCSLGICMATSNALALSLVNYKNVIGTASSLFGFFYYCLISLFTFFMGLLHNGSLLPMPLYFFALSWLMVLINQSLLKENK